MPSVIGFCLSTNVRLKVTDRHTAAAAGSNRDAIGARLLLTTEDSLQVWREVHGTIGYLSVHPREQHFGMGASTEGKVAIIWPNGDREEIGPLSANRRYIIAQGGGIVSE